IPERHAIYERDRHQCQVPGCERRAELHSHHIVPLGLGGPDVEANQVCVCSAHHKLIHEGRLRVSGQAPDELRWDLGGGLLRTLGMRIVAQR
ncbi:MAG: HNH endonuclease signature motif containing protein, partial [Candidatus Eisenbacteria bacterium]|nr:HNH endonuclease signature motif containing protein [Candidatus Eisenbacteria bacterium]